MHTNLIARFTEKIRLAAAEQERLPDCFRLRHMRKKKSIVQEHEICRILIFVGKGSFRSYTIDEKGVAHVLQLALENHWVSPTCIVFSTDPERVFLPGFSQGIIMRYSVALKPTGKK